MAQLSLTFRMPKPKGVILSREAETQMYLLKSLLIQLFLASSTSLYCLEHLPQSKQFYSGKQQINMPFQVKSLTKLFGLTSLGGLDLMLLYVIGSEPLSKRASILTP